jgi:hypothetical protein
MTRAREALLGPSYFHHRGLIEESKRWSADQIREYQQQRTERLVSRYGGEVTQKESYRRELGRYTRWDVPLLSRTVRTGGTSGQPLRFRADTFSRRQKERAYLFDAWSQVGYAPYDLRVCYRGEIHDSLVRFDRLENAWLISPGATIEQELGRLRRWVRTLPPKCRFDHRLKQDQRWKAEQLPDGTVRWTMPSGRQYATEPTRYPI